MRNSSKNEKLWESEYKKLLNKKDPLDQMILELVKENELRVNFVEVKGEDKVHHQEYSREKLPHKGKYTS
jgi:hypothetical protein